jgi:hypothetical protein
MNWRRLLTLGRHSVLGRLWPVPPTRPQTRLDLWAANLPAGWLAVWLPPAPAR